MRLCFFRLALLIVSIFGLGACNGCNPQKAPTQDPSADKPPGATSAAGSATAGAANSGAAGREVEVFLIYGSEKKTWLEESIKAFEPQKKTTASGRPITIRAKAMGSGESVQAIVNGTDKPHVFSPASSAYIALLNSAYAQKRAKPIAQPGETVVLSPVVIAMWKPMAEALGWPKSPIGWSDLLKVNLDPRGWGSKGFAEWGRFKLGHTHPEFSNSGFLSVLAEAYAGAKKTRGLSRADLDNPSTRKFLESVEQTIVHYGTSTGFFTDKMIARGPAYMSATVSYENLVIESYQKNPPQPIIAIYPKEGTFWSDHPYSILDAEWVGNEEREAAKIFLEFLKARPQQERALALGFRPGEASVPIASPIDLAHGVDPKQPQNLLEVPEVATLEKLLDVWKDTKKTTDVVLVFDKSGSMRGRPLEEAKRGAKSFLDVLSDRDEVTLSFFDTVVYPTVGPVKLGDGGRKQLAQRIDGVSAGGGTSLYDAIDKAYEDVSKRAASARGRIHAIVVMTDGNDEGSRLTLPALKRRFPNEADTPVKVFTIAYGEGASADVLDEIAESAKGSAARGSVETINRVYADMAAFF
ncbi:substrate-binding domain-containing protein [Pendulispora albinea]|uniref:VWA domain-containing protein n=1 Tax=Pendulispora albinea TaxID=2741071 RepID=A0ABZ2M358_9BACT